MKERKKKKNDKKYGAITSGSINYHGSFSRESFANVKRRHNCPILPKV